MSKLNKILVSLQKSPILLYVIEKHGKQINVNKLIDEKYMKKISALKMCFSVARTPESKKNG